MTPSTGFAESVPLVGDRVVLEPLTMEHVDDLAAAVADGELWRLWYTRVPEPAAMPDYVQDRLERAATGQLAAWATTSTATGRIVGMTTFLNLRPDNRKLEIGSTWLARSAQRTGINTEVKLLQLTRAFEQLECIAVELRTHWHNHQSRAAIARLGAKQDGVLRNNEVWRDGTVRDTVVFSIIDREWATVRLALRERLSS